MPRRSLEVRGLGYKVGEQGRGPRRGACEHRAQVQPPDWEPPDSSRQDVSRLTWTLLTYLMTRLPSAGRAHPLPRLGEALGGGAESSGGDQQFLRAVSAATGHAHTLARVRGYSVFT